MRKIIITIILVVITCLFFLQIIKTNCIKLDCISGKITQKDVKCNSTGEVKKSIKVKCSNCYGIGKLPCKNEETGIMLTFTQLFTFQPKTTTYKCENGKIRHKKCPFCVNSIVDCSVCKKTGLVTEIKNVNCSNCHGKGKIKIDCNHCYGYGKISLLKRYFDSDIAKLENEEYTKKLEKEKKDKKRKEEENRRKRIEKESKEREIRRQKRIAKKRRLKREIIKLARKSENIVSFDENTIYIKKEAVKYSIDLKYLKSYNRVVNKTYLTLNCYKSVYAEFYNLGSIVNSDGWKNSVNISTHYGDAKKMDRKFNELLSFYKGQVRNYETSSSSSNSSSNNNNHECRFCGNSGWRECTWCDGDGWKYKSLISTSKAKESCSSCGGRGTERCYH